jgi:transposase-like protein
MSERSEKLKHSGAKLLRRLGLWHRTQRQAAGQWKMPPREWFEAKTQFAILFGERFVQA